MQKFIFILAFIILFLVPYSLKDDHLTVKEMNSSISLSEIKYLPFLYLSSSSYEPLDFLQVYNISALHQEGFKGQNNRIVIVVAYGNDKALEDLIAFSQHYNLPNPDLNIIYPSGKPNEANYTWKVLTNLALQWSHVISPLSKKILIVAKNDTSDLEYATVYAINNYSPSIIVLPFGKFETAFANSTLNYFHSLFKDSVKVGSIIVSSSGNLGNQAVFYPSSDPYVLSVGSTIRNNNNEIGWSKSGGGYSIYFNAPQWQKSSKISNNKRAFPDLSFNIEGYKVYVDGSFVNVGGPSASSIIISAIVSLVNYKIKNINFLLHQIGTSSSYIDLFNDITSGNNGYNAKQGWDAVTGWGTPKVYNFVNFLSKNIRTVSIDYKNSKYSPYVKINGYEYEVPESFNFILNSSHIFEIQEKIEGNLERFVFNNWSGDLISNSSSITLTIDKDYLLIANYRTQYRVMVKSEYSEAYGDGWYDVNAKVTVSLKNDTVYLSNDTRAVFIEWVGYGLNAYNGKNLTFTIQIVGWVIQIAKWQRQYYLEVVSDYFDPKISGWYDENSNVTIKLENYTYYINEDIRDVFDHWKFLKPNYPLSKENILQIRIDQPMKIIAVWKKQYRLSITSYANDIKTKINVAGEGWYYENETAYFSSHRYHYFNNDTRLVLLGYRIDSGDLINSNEGQILMNKPYNIKFYWKIQYLVQTFTPISFINGTGWYDKGSIVKIFLKETIVYVDINTRYMFKGFNLTNYLNLDVKDFAILEIKVEKPIKVLALWALQYFVEVRSLFGKTFGTGWYDANSIVNFEVYPKEIYSYQNSRLIFSHWMVNGKEYYNNYLEVKSPLKIEAIYVLQHKVKIKVKDIEGNYIKNFQVVYLDKFGKERIFENEDWFNDGETLKIKEIIVNNERYYFLVEIPVYAAREMEIMLPIKNVEVMVKDIFGFPIKGIEIVLVTESGNKYLGYTNDEGKILFESVKLGKKIIKVKYILFDLEFEAKDHNVIILPLSFQSFILFLLFILILLTLILIRKYYIKLYFENILKIK
jgi:hypothetical protein